MGTSSGVPKIGKIRDETLDRGDHGNGFKRDLIVYVMFLLVSRGTKMGILILRC